MRRKCSRRLKRVGSGVRLAGGLYMFNAFLCVSVCVRKREREREGVYPSAPNQLHRNT